MANLSRENRFSVRRFFFSSSGKFSRFKTEGHRGGWLCNLSEDNSLKSKIATYEVLGFQALDFGRCALAFGRKSVFT